MDFFVYSISVSEFGATVTAGEQKASRVFLLFSLSLCVDCRNLRIVGDLMIRGFGDLLFRFNLKRL